MNICFNGDYLAADQPVIKADNGSYKWGDGVFETMRVWKGRILLADLHFERAFRSLSFLGINTSSATSKDSLENYVLTLASQNNCLHSARVRLSFFRDKDDTAGFCIEATSLQPDVHFNAKALTVDVFPYARKSMDVYSNMKSANYLPYVLAAKYAAQNKLGDSIVLNAAGHVCDSSRANIFLVKDREFYTPALNQGCVDGVMRRYLVGLLKDNDFIIHQKVVSVDDLDSADEVFLTNAIQVIQPVLQFRNREFSTDKTEQIFKHVIDQLFNEKEV